ncbi:hypothetical protein SCP_0300260 [Sparassis crispa]|uniref:Uncharacterized protein n=1 Tax=Sparassis crispa TaxID=139825 RepID=A0A401GDU8_9APHY|nr:hypothetical protein SCP_0300260 [Sparassis crispa]GBE80311.1 hypothetical protein SCP_0300260 [Sparassis crispa]
MALPTFFLFPSGLKSEDAKIGRIVANPLLPRESYVPEDPSPFIPDDLVHETSQRSVHSLLESVKKVEFRSALSKLFHAKYSKSGREHTTIDSALSRTVVLRNAENVLPELLKDEAIRAWITRQGSTKLYLPTGIKLFVDAYVSTGEGSDMDASAAATIPVVEIIAAAAPASLPSTGAGDIAIAGSRRGHAFSKTKFTAMGETIFAVEYRQLKNYRRRFLGYDFEGSRLGSGRTFQCAVTPLPVDKDEAGRAGRRIGEAASAAVAITGEELMSEIGVSVGKGINFTDVARNGFKVEDNEVLEEVDNLLTLAVDDFGPNIGGVYAVEGKGHEIWFLGADKGQAV